MTRDLFEPMLARRRWPIGAHIIVTLPLLAGREETRWVAFKLASATWYLDTLKELAAATGDLDRFFGVELALDGFLASASSAFDAAVAALTSALETGVPAAEQTPNHQVGWKRCKIVAARLSTPLGCEAEVDAALEGESDFSPAGWLAVLRRMRNRSTHHTTLGRHFSRNITDSIGTGKSSSTGGPTYLSLPGGGQAEPIAWCEGALQRTTALMEIMCADLARVLVSRGR